MFTDTYEPKRDEKTSLYSPLTGKFIVFEGPDGVGKTYQCGKACSYLFNLDKKNNVLLTKEPSCFYPEIRKALSKKDCEPEDEGEWYLRMFYMDRLKHIQELIEPALNRGVHVICDRYKYSTLAYQNLQGVPMKTIMDMHSDLIVPDLVIILNCSIEITRERTRERRSETDAVSCFDEAHDEFRKKLRENYLSLPKLLEKEPIHIVDASKSKKEVAKEIQTLIDKLF